MITGSLNTWKAENRPGGGGSDPATSRDGCSSSYLSGRRRMSLEESRIFSEESARIPDRSFSPFLWIFIKICPLLTHRNVELYSTAKSSQVSESNQGWMKDHYGGLCRVRLPASRCHQGYFPGGLPVYVSFLEGPSFSSQQCKFHKC